MFGSLVSGIVYGFAAAVSPGPLSVYLISQAVSRGWKRALPAVFSPLITDGPVALLVLVMLSRAPSGFIHYLRLFGGAFILYLAFETFRSWRHFNPDGAVIAESNQSTFLKAAVINWLNPNLYISWSVVLGPIVLSSWHKAPIKGIAILTGFYFTIVATMAWMVFMFSAVGKLGSGLRKSLIGISSIGLACLGIYQLWLGIVS
jgi:threonine/homoserine/homoserine lactone efflux protein